MIKEILSSNSIKTLVKYIPPVLHLTNSVKVLELFIKDRTLYALPIVDSDTCPVGLITRNKIFEIFGHQYARELYGRKPIIQFIDVPALIFDQEKDIDDVARILADSGPESIAEGFIVTCEGIYVGMGFGHDLLNAITEQKNAHLYQLAHYDTLTGLPSRMLFQDRLIQACSHAVRKNSESLKILVALLFLDLDRFKLVNDTLGHQMGDILLKEVAQRLLSCVRQEDTVARLGGDEFTVVLPRVKNTQDVAVVAQKIIDRLALPFRLCEHEVFIGVSIGIALFPLDDSDINNLIQKADTALYYVKEHGRNFYQFFTDEMNQAMSRRMNLEKDLRTAIESHSFFLFFQPQIDISTGRIESVEALIRWQHDGNLISPADFIPFAEETGLIVPIGEWVLRSACQYGKKWSDLGLPSIKISVNLSIRQLRQPNFIEQVNIILNETGVDPKILEFELTESMLMKNLNETLITLEKIKKIGISLAIDDFGTGYSSLSYLQKLPIDILKMDQSFVQGIDTEGANLNIINAIVGLAHGLGLTLVAEGVETDSQLNFLRHQKCDRIQGYLCSKPLAPNTLENILMRGSCLGNIQE